MQYEVIEYTPFEYGLVLASKFRTYWMELHVAVQPCNDNQQFINLLKGVVYCLDVVSNGSTVLISSHHVVAYDCSYKDSKPQKL
jgi:hypothetical protein